MFVVKVHDPYTGCLGIPATKFEFEFSHLFLN